MRNQHGGPILSDATGREVQGIKDCRRTRLSETGGGCHRTVVEKSFEGAASLRPVATWALTLYLPYETTPLLSRGLLSVPTPSEWPLSSGRLFGTSDP